MNESLTGPVPSDWRPTTLGEVCLRGGGDIQTGPFGSQLHASDYVPVGIPSIMPQNIGDNRIVADDIARISEADAERLQRYLVRPGDIVYSRRGDVERRALVREEQDGWLCGTGCLRVRLGQGVVDPAFAAFYLAHPAVRAWIVQHAVGATMPNLNTSILSAVPFLLPPLPEQRRISSILGSLDDKIELNRRMNRTLESIARAVFKSWFVDFDPVLKKMEGGEVRLSPDLAAPFPAYFDDSEIGPVPAAWESGSLGDVAALNSETWSSSTRPDVLQYVDLSNTKWGRIEACTTYVREDAPSRAQRVLRRGDTIVGTVRPGNGSYAYISEDGLTGSTGFASVRPFEAKYREFVYLAATAPENIASLAFLADGAAYPAVRPVAVTATPVVLAPHDVMARFAQMAAPLFDRMAHNNRESDLLTTLRDGLLPRLISGQLAMQGAERVAQ